MPETVDNDVSPDFANHRANPGKVVTTSRCSQFWSHFICCSRPAYLPFFYISSKTRFWSQLIWRVWWTAEGWRYCGGWGLEECASWSAFWFTCALVRPHSSTLRTRSCRLPGFTDGVTTFVGWLLLPHMRAYSHSRSRTVTRQQTNIFSLALVISAQKKFFLFRTFTSSPAFLSLLPLSLALLAPLALSFLPHALLWAFLLLTPPALFFLPRVLLWAFLLLAPPAQNEN